MSDCRARILLQRAQLLLDLWFEPGTVSCDAPFIYGFVEVEPPGPVRLPHRDR